MMATAYGDPSLNPSLGGKQHAKNQKLKGSDDADNTIFGDVDTLTDHARGGNDTITGGNSAGTDQYSNFLTTGSGATVFVAVTPADATQAARVVKARIVVRVFTVPPH